VDQLHYDAITWSARGRRRGGGHRAAVRLRLRGQHRRLYPRRALRKQPQHTEQDNRDVYRVVVTRHRLCFYCFFNVFLFSLTFHCYWNVVSNRRFVPAAPAAAPPSSAPRSELAGACQRRNCAAADWFTNSATSRRQCVCFLLRGWAVWIGYIYI